jgi:hypothetical protein
MTAWLLSIDPTTTRLLCRIDWETLVSKCREDDATVREGKIIQQRTDWIVGSQWLPLDLQTRP